MAPELVLASTSRYRRELLSRLQLPFICADPQITEQRQTDESGPAMCRRLAEDKARAVAMHHDARAVVGSDQCAVLEGKVIGKPSDPAAAVAQLHAASGRTVAFHTAVCVIASDGQTHAFSDITSVNFRQLDTATIERYVAIEQPMDCAGSFKVEGLGIALFESVDSRDPTALIGLPLIQLSACLRSLGFRIP